MGTSVTSQAHTPSFLQAGITLFLVLVLLSNSSYGLNDISYRLARAAVAGSAGTLHEAHGTVGAGSLRHHRALHGVVSCVLNSTRYLPSDLETSWTKHVREWAGKKASLQEYCAHIKDSSADIRHWLKVTHRLMATTGDTLVTVMDMKVLSHFRYTYDCGGSHHVFRVPIEPLAASLRHPWSWCKGPTGVGDREYLISKEYLLLASAYKAPFFESRTARAFIFDLGASLYSEGAGGASQQWFVETLLNRGFELDTYYGWEAAKTPDEQVFKQVPSWLQPWYVYLNFLAPTGVNDDANPLNILKRVAKKDDYVVLKIDIDNSEVEMKFIEQMQKDADILELVDEFFFEHHVNFPPMYTDWHTEEVPQDLGDTYALYRALRDRGIRAHGWV